MNVQINAVKFKADKKLEDFIQQKVSKLEQYYDGVLGSEVILRVDASEKPQNKITEIKLKIKGSDLFAKKQSDTFEQATDNAVEALRRQLKKHKEKVRGK
ncbi:MAG: ribosome-associated translation inhibitor RaiA [Bacteroidales bacterium]|nr:ribosome-associated translation inhibitor RaiA [Bacteroidales bacterium]MCF8328359.1 ribosome-associated translation inhibitor RaiA [Bacteroidales bacterium]